jgi:hypothetical protein
MWGRYLFGCPRASRSSDLIVEISRKPAERAGYPLIWEMFISKS